MFVFRERQGDIIKLLWWDGQGLCLFAKRLEKGRFVWPQADSGAVSLTPAQLLHPASIPLAHGVRFARHQCAV